ncbi:sulfotransferase family 2 domain-containing protein [Actomonas aquatica]|uniref:Sulfotransferase family 2 domain-containing protein n=1 Tax=Actomonas aquatica TaxID=2866162 RepID=A0ABZ1CAB8_9BACT|nr:sulfotransferase family 2 domain-containing protein [Opitutus sp. WL0086]WRQ88632.1 sulfotransferase family 2 domain-containing protein [Opitutus sp. WL0086]
MSTTASASPSPSTASRAWTIFRQPHFSPYKCYLRRDLGLGVLLNPKVGSTAFRKVLVEGLTNAGARPQLGPWWPVSRTRRYTTAPLPDYFHAFNHQDAYDFRCFVRNPYARVLSAWNDKLVKGFNSPDYPRSMRKLVPQLRRFAAERDLPGAADDAPFPFPSFLSYIESQAEGTRNQHWDTQRSVLLADHVRYRHTFHMETEFVSGMADTLALVGIPADWTAQKLARPTNASGKIKEPVYTDELAERVYQLYAVDFERFGYDRDSWQGM